MGVFSMTVLAAFIELKYFNPTVYTVKITTHLSDWVAVKRPLMSGLRDWKWNFMQRVERRVEEKKREE